MHEEKKKRLPHNQSPIFKLFPICLYKSIPTLWLQAITQFIKAFVFLTCCHDLCLILFNKNKPLKTEAVSVKHVFKLNP